jgi:hypothetical protein
MAIVTARATLRGILRSLVLLGLTASAAFPDGLCPDQTGVPQFDPANHTSCAALWPVVQNPSVDGLAKPLDQYEKAVGEFFAKFCHRDPDLTDANGNGWTHDKNVRDTGPYVAHRDENNAWVGEYHGFHAPVVIWYSPGMHAWLEVNRPLEGPQVDNPPPIPDGTMLVKEMYTPPGSRCRASDAEGQGKVDDYLKTLKPAHGIAYMVRDSAASYDGWFWGYWGYSKDGTDQNIDWPAPSAAPSRVGAANAPAYAGFGQYCVNCHASAINNSTFSSLQNVDGEPLVYLSQDWFLTAKEGDVPEHVPVPSSMAPIPQSVPLSEVPDEFKAFFTLPPNSKAPDVAQITLPSQTYDNVWVAALENGEIPLSSTYLTSDQCAGCHDAGSTGLTFDMTKPNPHGENLINLSPYATWKSSPMGLAGRDPIFYAQLSSEEQFHPKSLDLIWNTCFGCHGIMGQRQFQLDMAQTGQACEDTVFTPDIVTSVPYSGAQIVDGQAVHYDLANAKYGALARDGVSCVACHRTILTPEQDAKFGSGAQNACVAARQKGLNVDIGGLTGFGKTFTGSFLVSDPKTLFGPFPEPKTKPMAHALGNVPEHDPSIASSEQCGTCHTVHLPILWQPTDGEPMVVGDTFEQTTYPEWLFSQYRTGTAAFLPEGEMLPTGAGETPLSCAGCHMESHDENGQPFRSKIASIQERTNMPESDHTLPAHEIDLSPRDGFARHTLVGLNLFLIKMAQQFPDILGIPLEDPMLTSKGMAPLQRTEDKMVENARHNTADIAILDHKVHDLGDGKGDTLDVTLRIDNHAGHKFPSGVSFRRAFVEFEVLDASGAPLWHSGATNDYGVLIDANTGKPLPGELWYDDTCTKTAKGPDFQPHYQVIDTPNKVQIYQEVKLDPGASGPASAAPYCDKGAAISETSNLTTSFLSICHTVKDNRLLPAGLLPHADRVRIALALGLGAKGVRSEQTEAEMLADETGAEFVDGDKDYETGGGDTLSYRIPVSELAGTAASVRATLHYQATPPFYLQDRFCTGEGANRDRLYHLTSLLDTKGTPIEDWKFTMVSTGAVPIAY